MKISNAVCNHVYSIICVNSSDLSFNQLNESIPPNKLSENITTMWESLSFCLLFDFTFNYLDSLSFCQYFPHMFIGNMIILFFDLLWYVQWFIKQPPYWKYSILLWWSSTSSEAVSCFLFCPLFFYIKLYYIVHNISQTRVTTISHLMSVTDHVLNY